MLAIGIIVMQRALVGFDIGSDGVMVPGNPAQNGFGAANKLNYFLMCPLSALGTAIVSFNAQNLVAGRQDRIRRGTVKCIMIGSVMYLVLAGAGMLMTVNGAYQYVFMSADKISGGTIHYGNIYLYVDLAMYFLLMLLYVLRSGVQGDESTYREVCTLRAVTSQDAMTTDWYRMTYDVMQRCASRICNEVKGVNRVLYDITSKPPGTIEWE